MVFKIVGVAAYLLVLVAIGVAASRKNNDMRDFFAGGKKLGFLSVAFSARATGESGWLLLGLTGMGATIGAKAFWVVGSETVGVFLAWVLMARRFKRLTDKYDSITIPDYLEDRLNDTSQLIRKVSAGALVVFVTIYVSAQIDATGVAFESFLDVNYYIGILIGFAIVLVYITFGGFVAVVWSDVFQGMLMVVGLVVLPIVALMAAGGPREVTQILYEADPGLLTLMGPEGFTLASILEIVGFMLLGIGFLGSPQIFVRFLSLKNEGEIRKGTITAVVWTVLADGGAVLVGMIGRAVVLGSSNDISSLGNNGQDILPMVVDHVMPALLVGLYIAIVLSAIMSTIDSLLVLASSAVVRDVHQKINNPELTDKELMKTSRIAVIGLAAISLLLAVGVALFVPGRSVFFFVIFGWSGIAATFCPVMILSLFDRKLTVRGALASMVTGFISVPLLKFGIYPSGEFGALMSNLDVLGPAFIIALIVGFGVSRGDPAGQAAVTERAADLDEAAR